MMMSITWTFTVITQIASAEQKELYHSKECNEKFTLTQAEVESSMKTYDVSN